MAKARAVSKRQFGNSNGNGNGNNGDNNGNEGDNNDGNEGNNGGAGYLAEGGGAVAAAAVEVDAMVLVSGVLRIVVDCVPQLEFAAQIEKET